MCHVIACYLEREEREEREDVLSYEPIRVREWTQNCVVTHTLSPSSD